VKIGRLDWTGKAVVLKRRALAFGSVDRQVGLRVLEFGQEPVFKNGAAGLYRLVSPLVKNFFVFF
jgi:hypothetical protein